MKKQSIFLTVNQTSKMLNISTQTLKRWEKKGVINSRRNPINHYRQFLVTDVENLLLKLLHIEVEKQKFMNTITKSHETYWDEVLKQRDEWEKERIAFEEWQRNRSAKNK